MNTAQVEECQIEIVNGREEVRNLGEYEHSSMQKVLTFLLGMKDRERGTRTLFEQTIRISLTPDTRRVPDVAVFLRTTPIEPVFRNPPITIFEVLSRKDRVSRYNERIEDYMRIGVKRIYVIDPRTYRAWDVSNGNWVTTTLFNITDSETLTMGELLAALKEQEA